MLTIHIIPFQQQLIFLLRGSDGCLVDMAQGLTSLPGRYNPCQMEVSDVLTVKCTTLLPVQEDEELYVLQSQMMTVIYRPKWLQQYPRKLTGRKRKIISTAHGIATYWKLHMQKAYLLTTEC